MDTFKLDIKTDKNLLAFSAGIDSTALFFMMLAQNIPFDIAIVDYQQRQQSKEEVIYATQLAHRYNKKCFISQYPSDLKFSEKEARDYRHNFFHEIMINDQYKALFTAHQLNDKLEWFLMQLTKGAGLTELIGMESLSYKEHYQIQKPLLSLSKKTLQNYLDENKIKYFIDSSNYDEKYKRNYFRHNFSDELIEKFESGIGKSFEYLENDNRSLLKEVVVSKNKELSTYDFNGDTNIALRIIDKELKQRGIIISNATREEIATQKSLVVSHKIAITITENKIFIAPFISETMDKKFKERCRIAKIPINIRAYIYRLYQENLFIF